MTHCGIFFCHEIRENLCCADCKAGCSNRCQNDPSRCKCTTYTVSKHRKPSPERLKQKPVSTRQEIFRYLDAGCDVDTIEYKGFRRSYVLQCRIDWGKVRSTKPQRKTDLIAELIRDGLSDLEILAYGWDTKLVEKCRRAVEPDEP